MPLLRRIAADIHRAGGQALLVGGCVRDALLGRAQNDIDCEVHGLTQPDLLALLSRYGEVDKSGEPFGVYTLREPGLDFAIPRLERRTGALHTDFVVELHPTLTPAQAAARRDFTVNALMCDAITGELIDPYGGADDLERGVLRAVPGGQFQEDPLRVLRGAQFAARFSLMPDEATLALMRDMPLDNLTPARVLDEMKKALLHAENPSVFFRVLAACGGLLPWFAELDALRNIPQNPVYHPEGDAFEHTMLVLDEAVQERHRARDPFAFMLFSLVHDLGKATTTKKNDKGAWQSLKHEIEGLPLIEAMLSRISVRREIVREAKDMCALHMRVHTCYHGKARLSRTHLLFDESVCPRELAWLAICDARGTGKPRAQADEEQAFILGRLQAYEQAVQRPMPSGDLLIAAGAKPGPAIKYMIREARRAVLLGKPLEQAIEQVVRTSPLMNKPLKP